MDQIDVKTSAAAFRTLVTFAHPIQVQRKTSAAWFVGLRDSDETTISPRLVRNTAEDKSITGDVYLNIFRRIYEASETNPDTASGFRPRRFLISTESSSIENTLNARRIEDLRERFTSELLQALRQEPVEPGVLGQADAIIAKCLETNALATTTWLGELFIDNFNRPSVAADLLLLAGRLPYEVAKPAGLTMAISGLSHKSGAVQEAAIRAFENWATPDCLRILESVQVQPKWLNDYLEDVKRDLKAVCGETS